MTYDVTVISHKAKQQHACPYPGWWWRRKYGIGYGSVIRCNKCGQRWEWIANSYASDSPSWEKIDRDAPCAQRVDWREK